MREFVFGDIHGCADAFTALLDVLKPEPADTVVLLGDYIDRGPDSYAVIETILQLSRRCTVIALAGNHETMLLQARTDSGMASEWLLHGGRATLNSYERRGYAKSINAIPESHWHFFSEQTLDLWETEKHIFVHATVDPELDLDEQPDFLLFWQPFGVPTVHKSGKRMICGHTSQKSGLPAVFDNGICIDTWAHGDGWLTCFDTTKEAFYQCDNTGKHRAFNLQVLRDQR